MGYQKWTAADTSVGALCALVLIVVLVVVHYRSNLHLRTTWLLVGGLLAQLAGLLFVLQLDSQWWEIERLRSVLGWLIPRSLSEMLMVGALATVAVVTRSRWDTFAIGVCLSLTSGVTITVVQPYLEGLGRFDLQIALVDLCTVMGVGVVALSVAAIWLDRAKLGVTTAE
jgi:hypothetical protein